MKKYKKLSELSDVSKKVFRFNGKEYPSAEVANYEVGKICRGGKTYKGIYSENECKNMCGTLWHQKVVQDGCHAFPFFSCSKKHHFQETGECKCGCTLMTVL